MSTPSGPPIGEVQHANDKKPNNPAPVKTEKDSSERPIPTEGWPKKWFGIKKFFAVFLRLITFTLVKVSPKPPKLSKKEQAKLDDLERRQLELQREQDEREKATELLITLIEKIKRSAAIVQRIMAVMNSKGGSGKTPVAAYVAVILMYVIKNQVIIVDANENRGTTTRRMGVHGQKTLTISEVIRQFDKLADYNSVSSALAAHGETGVLVVGSNPLDQKFTRFEYVKGMTNLFSSCHSAVQDCGNGNNWPANDGSAIIATDLIFAALEYKPDSLVDLLTTMWVLKNDGHEDKIRNSWIVISATKPGQTVEHFYNELDRMAREDVQPIEEIDEHGVTRKRYLSLEQIGVSIDRIKLIPFDEYIAQDKIASAEAINVKTLIAYLELLDAIFHEGANYPKHQDQLRAEAELYRPFMPHTQQPTSSFNPTPVKE